MFVFNFWFDFSEKISKWSTLHVSDMSNVQQHPVWCDTTHNGWLQVIICTTHHVLCDCALWPRLYSRINSSGHSCACSYREQASLEVLLVLTIDLPPTSPKCWEIFPHTTDGIWYLAWFFYSRIIILPVHRFCGDRSTCSLLTQPTEVKQKFGHEL